MCYKRPLMDIGQIIHQIALGIVPFLLAITFHELAHALAADRLGDPTARAAGRITLNPIKHLELVGTLVFFLTRMIGWAKPVPVNPFNFRNPKRDMIWVSLAGPGANLLLAVVSALLLRALHLMLLTSPPEGSTAFFLVPLFHMARYGLIINVVLAIFNLIPIPPLDGSKILMGVLPEPQARALARIEPYGLLILILLIAIGGIDFVIRPVINLVIRILL